MPPGYDPADPLEPLEPLGGGTGPPFGGCPPLPLPLPLPMCGHLWVPVDDVDPPVPLDPLALFELFELLLPVEVVVAVEAEPVDEPEELPVLAVVAEPELPFVPEDPALVAALAIAAPPRTNPPARAPITMALRTGDFMFPSFPSGRWAVRRICGNGEEYEEARCEPAHER